MSERNVSDDGLFEVRALRASSVRALRASSVRALRASSVRPWKVLKVVAVQYFERLRFTPTRYKE